MTDEPLDIRGTPDVGMDHYQQMTEQTAIYPSELPDFVTPELLYVVLGLNGEVGELTEKIKKAIREDDESYLDDAIDELGDCSWYWLRVCEELDVEASTVATENMDKLLDRQERGVLEGSGDDR